MMCTVGQWKIITPPAIASGLAGAGEVVAVSARPSSGQHRRSNGNASILGNRSITEQSAFRISQRRRQCFGLVVVGVVGVDRLH